MKFDIKEIPFSRFGSYFCISQSKRDNYVYIRDVHGGDETPSNLFKIEIYDNNGEKAETIIVATETSVKLTVKDKPNQFVELILPEEDEIRIHTQDVTLKLKPSKQKYDSLMQVSENMYEYHIYSKELKLMLICLDGEMKVDAPWNIIDNHHIDIQLTDGDFIIKSYKTVYEVRDYKSFEKEKQNIKDMYKKWYCIISGDIESGKYISSVEKSAYITWANFVKPEGVLPYYSMYMSKNWMQNIWSWDNCFGSILLAKDYPQLAYSQLKVFFDHQDESGAYPDFVNDKFSSYNCIKPPIFLYAYEKMMELNDYFKDKRLIREVYESSKKVIDYFTKYRTFDGALPHYKHGNDSGWDNSSLFYAGMPAETPDLAAFLIRSCDIMSKFAEKLGEKEEQEKYKEKANILFELLMKRLYDEDGFYGRVGIEQTRIDVRSSLILYLPIMIGYRLEQSVKDQLVERLLKNHEETYGLATESTNSPFYKENGYWLGPIWAPVTYLFVDSLESFGFQEDAKRLKEKFLQLTLIGGMAENFDPLTGKGLVDTAFAWTSSVFLIFLREIGEVR